MSEYELEMYGIVGSMLRDIRLSKSITLDEASGHINVTSKTLQRYELGERKIKIGTIKDLLKYYNYSYDEFMKTAKQRFSNSSEEEYYLNTDTKKVAQEIFENKELRLLFDAAKDASPEDLQTVHTMLLALKKKEHNE